MKSALEPKDEDLIGGDLVLSVEEISNKKSSYAKFKERELLKQKACIIEPDVKNLTRSQLRKSLKSENENVEKAEKLLDFQWQELLDENDDIGLRTVRKNSGESKQIILYPSLLFRPASYRPMVLS